MWWIFCLKWQKVWCPLALTKQANGWAPEANTGLCSTHAHRSSHLCRCWVALVCRLGTVAEQCAATAPQRRKRWLCNLQSVRLILSARTPSQSGDWRQIGIVIARTPRLPFLFFIHKSSGTAALERNNTQHIIITGARKKTTQFEFRGAGEWRGRGGEERRGEERVPRISFRVWPRPLHPHRL